MSSVRCPGKVLRNAGGHSLLDYLCGRLKKASKLEGVIVATSETPGDDSIAAYCAGRGIRCFRGSLANVTSRFENLLQAMPFDAFVRISADSPMLDPAIVDRAIDLFLGGQYDIVSNVETRSFPKGQSVEVINSKTFLETVPKMLLAEDLEHVTSYFYKNPQDYKIKNFTVEDGKNYSKMNLSIDTEYDFSRFSEFVLKNADFMSWGWNSILEMYPDMVGSPAL